MEDHTHNKKCQDSSDTLSDSCLTDEDFASQESENLTEYEEHQVVFEMDFIEAAFQQIVNDLSPQSLQDLMVDEEVEELIECYDEDISDILTRGEDDSEDVQQNDYRKNGQESEEYDKVNLQQKVLELKGLLQIYLDQKTEEVRLFLLEKLRNEDLPVEILETSRRIIINREADNVNEELELWVKEGIAAVDRLLGIELGTEISRKYLDIAARFALECLEDYLDQPKRCQALTISCLSSFGENLFIGKILVQNQITIFHEISRALKNCASSDMEIQHAFWNMVTLFDAVWKRFCYSITQDKQSNLASSALQKNTEMMGPEPDHGVLQMEREVMPSWLAGIKSCIYGIAKHADIRSELMRIYNEMKQLNKVLKA